MLLCKPDPVATWCLNAKQPNTRNTMTEKFDAIVIGAGQAGPALAVRCGKEGLKTVLIVRLA